MDYLLLKRKKKRGTKIKWGFLGRHDDFNDAHIKDKNWNIKRAS